ncbi:hypothetical protein ASD32_01810 [Rhizobium sp. Root483D2]|nr:hypothetical protein ASD32_01810 [Rhizobium sp. Root483D2]
MRVAENNGTVIHERLGNIEANHTVLFNSFTDNPRSFSTLSEPRQGWRVIYPLPEVLLLVLCATLCGMEDFVEIRLWGEERMDFLQRF